MAKFNGRQIEAIQDAARKAAQAFVDEFNEPLDTAETDWDATAWEIDRSSVGLDYDEARTDEAFEIYQTELVAETERLCGEISHAN